MTPYINVCDVFVKSGEERSTVALLTVLGHLYEKSTGPELSFTEMYLPDVTDTDVTEEYGCDADVGLLVAPPREVRHNRCCQLLRTALRHYSCQKE